MDVYGRHARESVSKLVPTFGAATNARDFGCARQAVCLDLTSAVPIISLICISLNLVMSNKIRSAKAKLKSKLTTSTEDKERLKRACSTAISGLEVTLGIAKQVAGSIGVPGLQAGICGLLFVLDVVKVNFHHAPLHIIINDRAEIVSKSG